MGIDFVSVNTTRLHLQAQRALFDDLRNCPAKLKATRKELKGGV
jgi:hypothetical protein